MFRIIKDFKKGMEVARRDNSNPAEFEEGTAERWIAEHAQEADTLEEFAGVVRDDSRIMFEADDLDQAIAFYQEYYSSDE